MDFCLMPYLRKRDYIQQIQDANLQQVITSDDSIRLIAEQTAQAEIISKLTQKYDCTDEFRNTTVYSPALTYKAKALVYLDATAYSASATYALNALTLQSGNVYKCTTAITVGEAFTLSKWQLLGAQYDLFNAILPESEFDITKSYVKTNEVFWKDKVYTSAVDSVGVFPDDATYGSYYWGTGVAYSVPADSLLNATYFAAGDNRSYQLVQMMIDITLYHLHSRISPRNIPDLRVKRYDDAIRMLKEFANGLATLDVPKIQPKSGHRIRYGGNTKNINSY
jgi:hypothetical protein